MAARYIVTGYVNQKGNKRLSILMSETDARKLAVNDMIEHEKLSETIFDYLQKKDNEE